jgi:hypothetical protein
VRCARADQRGRMHDRIASVHDALERIDGGAHVADDDVASDPVEMRAVAARAHERAYSVTVCGELLGHVAAHEPGATRQEYAQSAFRNGHCALTFAA